MIITSCSCPAYFLLHQVSDVEQYMGLMHTEAIQVHAEAYDVALDISFPRGEWPAPANVCWSHIRGTHSRCTYLCAVYVLQCELQLYSTKHVCTFCAC